MPAMSTPARRRAAVLAVAAGAAVNLVLAVVLLREPARAADLRIVFDWCSRWLRHGEDLYATLSSSVDYPPNAIVLFSPLALIPPGVLVPLWAAITVVLTAAFAYVAVRVTAPRATGEAAMVPILLFLCWGGVRMLLQFTRVTVTAAYAAVLYADSRPLASGVLLAVGLSKPQIAGPIALWMLFTKRWRQLAVAGGVSLLAAAVYVIHAHASPIGVLTGWTATVRALYADPTALVGRTSIRRWTYGLAGDSSAADAMWAAGAVLLLIIPCGAALAEAGRRSSRAAAVPALFCLWSLLVWFHLGNDLVLLFPAFAFLLLLDDPPTHRGRMMIAAAMQIVLMLDLPVHLIGYAPMLGPLSFLVADADRLMTIGVFFYLAFLWWRLRDGPEQPGARPRHRSGEFSQS